MLLWGAVPCHRALAMFAEKSVRQRRLAEVQEEL